MHFNPRPREEGDLVPSSFTVPVFFISIHALVKRATQASIDSQAPHHDFNPRPREEGDVVNYHVAAVP